MKLQLIAECHPKCLVEFQHGWQNSGDQIAAEQSAKSLVQTALGKIRNMLGEMGLTKNPLQQHRVAEPIGPAVVPFDNLRQKVRERAQQDAKYLLQGKSKEQVNAFWGFQTPANFYDNIGAHGRANATGRFDEMIRQAVDAAEKQPVEVKIELLERLAQSL